MREIACPECRAPYDGGRHGWCPDCLAARWLATPELIRPKHDPRVAAEARDRYRSIVTPSLLDDLAAVLADAAERGWWFWDRDYEMWVHVTDRPLGRTPGVGIPAGSREPDHALAGLFIAEADSASQAHLFAADLERHAAQVKVGVFTPLGACSSAGCRNLARPGGPGCAEHPDAPGETILQNVEPPARGR